VRLSSRPDIFRDAILCARESDKVIAIYDAGYQPATSQVAPSKPKLEDFS
jgi:hypothetical protein